MSEEENRFADEYMRAVAGDHGVKSVDITGDGEGEGEEEAARLSDSDGSLFSVETVTLDIKRLRARSQELTSNSDPRQRRISGRERENNIGLERPMPGKTGVANQQKRPECSAELSRRNSGREFKYGCIPQPANRSGRHGDGAVHNETPKKKISYWGIKQLWRLLVHGQRHTVTGRRTSISSRPVQQTKSRKPLYHA